MHQTFKHISIFLIFLASLLVWYTAGEWLQQQFFGFRYGKTVYLMLWSTCVVVIFHLLYYYMSKWQEKSIYLSSLTMVLCTGTLIYFGKLLLP